MRDKPMVIGFTGLIGAGKTTASTYLISKYDFSLHKFASPLKRFCKMIGLSYEQHSGDEREIPLDILCGKSPRQLQQLLGTEFGRDLIGPDFWVKVWEHTIPSGNIVVDDVRFPNEVAMVRSLGGVIINIKRKEATESKQSHASETQTLSYDGAIMNDGDIKHLIENVEKVYQYIQKGYP